MTKNMAQSVVDLGRLVLRLGRVERATFHEDGLRPETDTDHTVMLALIAPAFAQRHLPELDRGKIVIYALVHDLVEAYAGDTATLRITQEEHQRKTMREHMAADQIVDEFIDTLPWLPAMISSYEMQRAPEARYVKAMDKLLPKIAHILNHGQSLRLAGVDAMELFQIYGQQGDDLRRYAVDFPPLFELREQLLTMLFDSVYKEVGS